MLSPGDLQLSAKCFRPNPGPPSETHAPKKRENGQVSLARKQTFLVPLIRAFPPFASLSLSRHSVFPKLSLTHTHTYSLALALSLSQYIYICLPISLSLSLSLSLSRFEKGEKVNKEKGLSLSLARTHARRQCGSIFRCNVPSLGSIVLQHKKDTSERVLSARSLWH